MSGDSSVDNMLPSAPQSKPVYGRLLWLQVIFVLSGVCGLIYEAIWSHYLKLFVGHAAYAQTLVLIVFIGGMAIGAWLIGRITHRISAPLMVYAAVEATVGVISLVFHRAFVSLTEWGYSTLLPAACAPDSPCVAQWLLAAGMILPQSILLGTTFPLMTSGILRLTRGEPGSRIALFYFLNSIGAVVGVLAAAFFLIPNLGLPGTLLTAGLMNIGVACAAYACAKGAEGAPAHSTGGPSTQQSNPSLRRLLIAVAIFTGLSSFIYEIVWIRMLSLVIGASTDAFELMLAAFILGLALGGLAIKQRIDRFLDLMKVLAVVQILMGIAAVLTLPVYDASFDLFAWLLRGLGRSESSYILYNVASHGVALLVMLPATILAGMTLPLITTILLRNGAGEGSIGFVYAANTLGAILGVALTVHFAMPMLGLKGALLLGAAIDVVLGGLIFLHNRGRSSLAAGMRWVVAGSATLVLVAAIVPVSLDRMASGVYRHGEARLDPEFVNIFHRDGKTANIDVLQVAHLISIRTNGKSDAAISSDPVRASPDEYTMAFAAILPLALHPQAETAAVIGFGSGMSTDTLLRSPNLKRVDTIEIEAAMVEGARHFGKQVERAYTDPRSFIVIDDAKSYFARNGKQYDIILSEPSNPWVSGVASLFTSEFYARIKHQLTEKGVLVQWIQIYEFSDALLSTILRAIDGEFADYAVYQANSGDLMIVAGNNQLPEPNSAFLQFPDLEPILHRLSYDSLPEIQLRRIAGKETVRSMIDGMGRGLNSDYYPIVDSGAARARFVGSKATGLVNLAGARLPVVEMLERRRPVALAEISKTSGELERRESAAIAQATARWLVEGKASKAQMPRDVALLRAAFWKCAELPPRVSLVPLMLDIAEYVNPHLPPEQAKGVWQSLRSAPCASRLNPEENVWLDLHEATALRDGPQMAKLGLLLLNGQGVTLDERARGHVLAATALGMIAADRHVEAAQLLDKHLPPTGMGSVSRSVSMALRGYAAHGGG